MMILHDRTATSTDGVSIRLFNALSGGRELTSYNPADPNDLGRRSSIPSPGTVSNTTFTTISAGLSLAVDWSTAARRTRLTGSL